MNKARSLVVIVPGSLESRTGGYEYDRQLIAGLRARGWAVEVREIDGSFPHPTPAALADAAHALAGIADQATVLVDGLAFSAMPDQVEHESHRLRMVALIHMPLGAEIGISGEVAARLDAGERRAIGCAASVIVTGRATAAALTRSGVAPHLVTIVEPGTAPAPLALGSQQGPLRLLCVATLNRGKGHDILFRALAAVANSHWHLTCAGSLDRDPQTARQLRATLRALGLADRVSVAGELDGAALEVCYREADVFLLATLHETYGMAVAEALAHGLSVVSTATGGIPELVGSDAGLIVPPGDAQAFTAAVSKILTDPELRARLAAGARRVRERLPTWESAVAKASDVLERVVSNDHRTR